MKTDNSIVSNVESLEDAIYRFYPLSSILDDYIDEAEREAFSKGANWQKEQLKPIIESHAELLEALNPFYEFAKEVLKYGQNRKGEYVGFNGKYLTYEDFRKTIEVVEKANKLINQ